MKKKLFFTVFQIIVINLYGQVVTEDTYFSYDNNGNVIKEQIVNSSGIERITEFKYPYDFANSEPNNVYAQMVTQNKLSFVVEKRIYNRKNNVSYLTKAELISYKNNNGVTLPEKSFVFESPIPLDSSQVKKTYYSGLLVFDNKYKVDKSYKYNTLGRLSEISSSGGSVVSYLWGYKGMLPVAKIEGAPIEIVSQLVSDNSILNNPSSDLALRNYLNGLRTINNANVYSYTYEPLIGMTSATDETGRTTFYKYDESGRISEELYESNDRKVIYQYKLALQPDYINGTPVFKNGFFSSEFVKNNCTVAFASIDTFTYSVPMGKYTSTVSQKQADSMALADLNVNGQVFANQNGRCLYVNNEMSRDFLKDDCPQGTLFTIPYKYIVPARKYSSFISQEDANAQAINDINLNGLDAARLYGVCRDEPFYNGELSMVFKKTNCGSGSKGDSILYVVEARKHSSFVSQDDVNLKAMNDLYNNGPSYANAHGSCSSSPCSFDIYKSSGFTNMIAIINGSGGTSVPLGLTFYVPNSNYPDLYQRQYIGSISGGCIPHSSSEQQLSTTDQTGREWIVIINIGGGVSVRIKEGQPSIQPGSYVRLNTVYFTL
ncbi:MAG: DUF5977 domain-containing protein [Niabella sp.]